MGVGRRHGYPFLPVLSSELMFRTVLTGQTLESIGTEVWKDQNGAKRIRPEVLTAIHVPKETRTLLGMQGFGMPSGEDNGSPGLQTVWETRLFATIRQIPRCSCGKPLMSKLAVETKRPP